MRSQRPRPAQLFLDCNAWLQWRIPYFNSQQYGLVVAFTGFTNALTAMYFIGSALRAWRYLSNDSIGEEGDGATNTANKSAMRQLMRRVLTSGCLMLVVTVGLTISTNFIFHPLGFAGLSSVFYPIVMVNSLLQIESFAPASEAPTGPLRKSWLAVTLWVHRLMDRGERWLASSSSAKPNRLVRVSQKRRISHIDSQGFALLRSITEAAQQPVQDTANGEAPGNNDPQRKPNKNAFPRTISRSISFVAPRNNDVISHSNQLKPWERSGISIRFLDAFVRTHAITPDMTTTDVMEKFIKPETVALKCCYVELLTNANRCPREWLGKPTHFASHWWGYKFLDLVRALRA